MYARSTTWQARPETIDAGIAHLRDEVMPALLAMDGCAGLSMIVDRSSGRCIATSSWYDAEAMHASAEAVRPLRDHAGEVLGGNRAQVDEWEIAVLHRDHFAPEGSCVRATWARFGESPDRAIEVYKSFTVPEAERMDGFCSASLMIDGAAGIGVSSMTYDSMAAMDRSRPQADQMRAATVNQARIDLLEVAEFELAIAHLHVPETV